MRIYHCRIFHSLLHFSHISAKCAYCIFFYLNWHFWRQFALQFTLTIWLPTEWHYPCVRTLVERDGVVGFKQFCTIFPHIFPAYLLFIQCTYFFKCCIKLVCLFETTRAPRITWLNTVQRDLRVYNFPSH